MMTTQSMPFKNHQFDDPTKISRKTRVAVVGQFYYCLFYNKTIKAVAGSFEINPSGASVPSVRLVINRMQSFSLRCTELATTSGTEQQA